MLKEQYKKEIDNSFHWNIEHINKYNKKAEQMNLY